MEENIFKHVHFLLMRVIEDLFISINRLKKEIKVLQQVIAYTKETLRLKKACILFVWLD